LLPRNFQYYAPKSVDDAVKFLAGHPGEAKVIAGGMSLIPLMKMRLASPSFLVDINGLEHLGSIEESGDRGSLLIGSLTRHHDLESSPLVMNKALLVAETAGLIGDPQVRNLGTIGGALAHSDPSGDWGAAMLALRAEVRVVGPAGERRIPIDDFLVDTFTTSLREDELITQLSIPVYSQPGSGGAYVKLERKAGDFATVGVAAQVSLARDGGRCTYAGIGLTAVGPKSIRASKAEGVLMGSALSDEKVSEAAGSAAKECSPSTDPLRGSAEYKREMVRVMTRRALELAAKRAREGGGLPRR